MPRDCVYSKEEKNMQCQVSISRPLTDKVHT